MYHKLVYDTLMPHVSRVKLERKLEENLLNVLDIVLARLSKEQDIRIFLMSLLSPTEKLMLAKRLAIIALLKEGLPESRIASTLNVTRITVSRLNLFLEARGEGYELAMKILHNEKFVKEIKGNLVKLAGYVVRSAGGRI